MQLEELSKQIEEVSQSYAGKFAIRRDVDWALLKLVEEVGELTRAHLKLTLRSRVSRDEAESLRTSFEDELADVLGQVLVMAHIANVDLANAIDRKWLAWHPDRQLR